MIRLKDQIESNVKMSRKYDACSIKYVKTPFFKCIIFSEVFSQLIIASQ